MALQCWRAAPPRGVRLQTNDTAPWPLLEAGYGAVVVHWSVRG
jgi:hypothetical protein